MAERREMKGPIPPRTAFEDLLAESQAKEWKEARQRYKSKKGLAERRAHEETVKKYDAFKRAQRADQPVTIEETADHLIREEEMKPKKKARKPKKADA
jgi:hypothetical protein